MSTIIPGWKKAAKKYGVQASIEDLEEVKDSLEKLARGNGKCCSDPVHQAASNGSVKLIKFILATSYNLNTKNNERYTVLPWACIGGQTETVKLLISVICGCKRCFFRFFLSIELPTQFVSYDT